MVFLVVVPIVFLDFVSYIYGLQNSSLAVQPNAFVEGTIELSLRLPAPELVEVTAQIHTNPAINYQYVSPALKLCLSENLCSTPDTADVLNRTSFCCVLKDD